jgi:surface protein
MSDSMIISDEETVNIPPLPQINDSNIHEFVKNYVNNKDLLPDGLKNIPIGEWDVSEVTNMEKLFFYNYDRNSKFKDFNEDLNDWNVSKVTSMKNMFGECLSFNKPLNKWDVSNVESMELMFYSCIVFNQPLNDWGDKTGRVKNMSGMFRACSKFNQPLNDWDVSNVTTMKEMFYACEKFNQSLDWGDKTGRVNDMTNMFIGCKKFNQSLNEWDVSNVISMKDMFNGCLNFNQPLNEWGEKIGRVRDMTNMFYDCKKFNQPLNSWIISSSTIVLDMFKKCPIIEENKPQISNNNTSDARFGQRLEIHRANLRRRLNDYRPAPSTIFNFDRTEPISTFTPTRLNFDGIVPPARPTNTTIITEIKNKVENMIQNNQSVIEKYTGSVNLNLEVVDIYDLTYDDNGNKIEGTENVNVFLNHNPDNIVFLFENNLFFSNKTYIKQTLEDKEFIKFGCISLDTLRPENIVRDKPYIPLKQLGLYGGLITVLQAFGVLLGNNRFFRVSKTAESLVSTVSLSVLEGGNRVSASHCQEGQDDIVYLIEYIELPTGTGGKKRKTRKTRKTKKTKRRGVRKTKKTNV